MREIYRKRVETLLESLPYIRMFSGSTMVIKYGGAAMSSADLKDEFATDIALLRYVGIKPIIVHGGGNEISAYMKRLDLPVKFVDGLRVTDAATMEVAKMVLVGKVNKEIVSLINSKGAPAVGLCGDDGGLLQGRAAGQAGPGRRRPRPGPGGRGHRGQHRAAHPAGGRLRAGGGLGGRRPGRGELQHQRRHGGRSAGGRAEGREGHLPHRRRAVCMTDLEDESSVLSECTAADVLRADGERQGLRRG